MFTVVAVKEQDSDKAATGVILANPRRTGADLVWVLSLDNQSA